MAEPKTREEAQIQVDAANDVQKRASVVTGIKRSPGTIETFFPGKTFVENTPAPVNTDNNDRVERTTESTAINDVESTLVAPISNVESAADIQARKTKAAQGEIDALNKLFQSKIAEQRIVNQGQERQTSSVSTLTGLAGSTEANVQATQTEKLGSKQIEAIQNEQAVAVSAVLSKIRSSAVEEAKTQREEARQSAVDTLALRTQRVSEAVNNITVLAQSGVTAEGLKNTDPESYNQLVNTLGSEALLKGYLTLNRPVDTLLDSRIEGGKYVTAFQNPITGEVTVESVDLGLPDGFSQTIDAGDRIIAVPDDWDGDTANLVTINKGITPGQLQTSKDKAAALAAKETAKTESTGNVDRDVASIMAGTLNLPDVSVKDNFRADVAAGLTEKFNEAKASGDLSGIMRSSAVYDKEPSDSFLQSFEKVSNVLGQLEVLQDSLVNGFDEGKVEGIKTGPILGAFKEANPWDTQGQVIKAQLNAIVPNLARGVYGEVGVLTDNDIKTYSKTIPNLKSTKDVRDAVLYITADMIRKSMANKIKTQAAGQRDMSGFAGIFEQMNAQADSILESINGTTTETQNPNQTLDGIEYAFNPDDGLYYPVQ